MLQAHRTTFGAWILASIVAALAVWSSPSTGQPTTQPKDSPFPLIQLPPGCRIEKVAEGLTYPTAVCWDDKGAMYVAEAGGAFLDEPPPARILKVEAGKVTEVVTFDKKQVGAAVAGMCWHKGAFYITHRDPKDYTGCVSRVTPDGKVTRILGGIIDSVSDHQPNDIRVGPDGRMYVCVGVGGNSGTMGQDMTPYVLKFNTGHPTPAKDIVLTGVNLRSPDFRTKEPGDFADSGAFMPFGTPTKPGQVVKGTNKAGGSILVFDPDNAERTVKPYAWGFRNVVGMAWTKDGQMYACQNGYDMVPPRPIKDEYDPTYQVKEGAWYGWPDFTATGDPVTDPKYAPPGSLLAPVYVEGKQQEKKLYFLIDHKASGLTPPDKKLVAGLHPINSSPSQPDVAPDSWGEWAGHLFVPEWGDMAWFNNAMRDKPAGNRIVRIDPKAPGKVEPFAHNAKPGPASEQDAKGLGIERPFNVRFGPDGAMYVVDYGMHRIVLARIADGRYPFEWPVKTGVVWKITRTDAKK